MPNTPNGLPFPALSDDANGPVAFQALAIGVDTAYGGHVTNAAALPGAGLFLGQQVRLDDTGEVAVWNGATWEGYWKSFTTTLGFTNATVTAAYVKLGKLVTVEFDITFTGTPTGNFSTTPPTTFANTNGSHGAGTCIMIDASVGNSSRRSAVIAVSSAATYFLVSSLTASATAGVSVPWVWTTGDTINGTYTYREA